MGSEKRQVKTDRQREDGVKKGASEQHVQRVMSTVAPTTIKVSMCSYLLYTSCPSC